MITNLNKELEVMTIILNNVDVIITNKDKEKIKSCPIPKSFKNIFDMLNNQLDLTLGTDNLPHILQKFHI